MAGIKKDDVEKWRADANRYRWLRAYKAPQLAALLRLIKWAEDGSDHDAAIDALLFVQDGNRPSVESVSATGRDLNAVKRGR